MDIFNSQWLLNMLAKSSKTPEGRILSLFDILGDWLEAPNVLLDINKDINPSQQLVTFFTSQAKACGAENPSMLAEHVVLIAKNATQQEINQPGCNSLIHAKKAANALILAQTQKEWFFSGITISKRVSYSVAASIFVVTVAAAILLPNLLKNSRLQTTIAGKNIVKDKATLALAPQQANTSITARDAAAMYAKFEQMRNGTCQFPEVIQIPDKDKAIYLVNVVGGKLPTDLHDLAVANSYLEKVRCNFTPMLMAHSK
jgi:hypothetical protein